MAKRLFLSITLSLALLSAYAGTSYQEDPAVPTAETSMPDGQVMVEADDVNSTDINEVEESKVAQEMIQAEENAKSKTMTQAEKAENARVNDSWGGAITIIAMCIVIGSLVVLSLLFLLFGKISSTIMSRSKMKAHGKTKEDAEDHHMELDSGETIAAIAMALAEHFDTSHHDLEDTILTIKKLRRAYSPWNSKIYNLRPQPELHRNARK